MDRATADRLAAEGLTAVATRDEIDQHGLTWALDQLDDDDIAQVVDSVVDLAAALVRTVAEDYEITPREVLARVERRETPGQTG